MNNFKEFTKFFKEYTVSRLIYFGKLFEKIKDLIVALLIVKRGRYSTSFLNTSFFILITSSFIAAPIIAENNPFFNNYSQLSESGNQKEIVYNPNEFSVETIYSAKPRSGIEDYIVAPGDTLSSIAEKFDISVDTIKWANNLKTETIKPGQILKIPPVTGVVHKVTSGETIYSIAKKYKTSPQNIINFPFNEFTSLDTFGLTVGQILYVPDGIIEEETKPATPRYFAQVQQGARGSSNFIWPTSGGITQYFVWYHPAIDIANASAPSILAADRGTVTFAGCFAYGYGCHIIVNHNNGFETLYAHLSRLDVSSGQVVNQGQQIGVMGSTGRSTGTHLHFEIRANGIPQNPLNYLR